MSGSTRGKLKEHCEGIHRNCEWIKNHCIDCLGLIEDRNEQLSNAFAQLGVLSDQLDEFAAKLYTQF